ncbi:hypothetical protein J5N97_002350 [Dioscorea zingiberensis]|uniref:DYW domain-containing protein n=1 Tax=Dioscorea zingiberensis TaxID=325984 RepID=A0A9D5D3M6_9LILI|nr:hypothetical protein J5N97_002350 [Dioscorea zingiberensis]
MNRGGRAAEQACLSLLDSCNSVPKLLQAQAHLLKLGLHSNPLVLTKFTSTCSALDAISSATSLLFSPLSSPHLYDAFLFNTLIRSLAHSHLPDSKLLAVSYFSLMLRRGLFPNKFTFPFLLKACAGVPSPHLLGPQAHAAAIKFSFGDDLFVRNTLIHMYACCAGGLESARKVFDGLPKTSAVSWSAMIGGYVRSGLSNEAVTLFREMQISGVQPDEITVVAVLSACGDLGALELGKWIKSFVERERIPKTLPLCNALLDALAKSGDIDGALKLFVEMPDRSIVSWTSVIDGLAMHGRGPGDELHSKYKDVFEMVEEMGRKLKLAGYVPVISEVLLDIDEEDKEDALHQHSEKIAIAFALLRTAPGMTIRIVKNLRVCADCHSATKFISKVYDREIIVRDRNRFHHFKDGLCSCKDFW